MSDDPYGEKDYTIKPSKSHINLDGGEVIEPKCKHGNPEALCGICAEEDAMMIEIIEGRKALNAENELITQSQNDLIKQEENRQTKEDTLRELALSLDPKYGDKLYPLEVLGVYNLVLNERHMDVVTLVGMPENYIDNAIKNWVITIDKSRFANRLERVLDQDIDIRETFLLRLNYAFLLEEEEESIVIYRGCQQKLLFGEVDVEGNYIGDLESAGDLTDEDLDERAANFYSSQEKIFSRLIGTPMSTRAKIKQCLDLMGYVINFDVDEVYHNLNKANKSHFEAGLVARVAYLVFLSEDSSSLPSLLD
jgi:hypothetical protein